jgi:hypothetical protein
MTQVTPAQAWTLPAMASIHLCLAVQITAPDDNFAPPTLIGNKPGPADPLIIADNNKAQRNLQDTVATSGTPGTAEMFAKIRNGERKARRMEIGIHWPRGVSAQAQASIVGGSTVELREPGEFRISLGKMNPGEIRWLKFRVRPESDQPAIVDFYDPEGVDQRPSNGFSIQFARAQFKIVAGRNMSAFADVLTRIAILETSAEADREAAAARKALENATIPSASYLAYMKAHRPAITRIVRDHLKAS